MNIFETEHPMDSQSSWFDRRKHPKLSFVCSTFLLAAVIAPVILVCLYFWAISDIGAEPNPFPEPLRAFTISVIFAFIVSFVLAALLVLIYRLVRQFGSNKFE